MPDFGNPVADQITAPNPNQTIQSLSGILGIAQQQQGLQQGAQQLQIGQAAAQSAQQQMDERQMLQGTLQSGKDPDGNPIKSADGQIDPVALSKFAGKYLPLTGQDVTQHVIATMNNKLQLNDGVRTLGQSYRNDISGIIGAGVGAPDPSVISTGLDAYAQQNPQAAGVIANAKNMLQGIGPSTPQAQRDMALKHVQMLLQPAATTAEQQQPQIGTTTGPGGGVQAIQTNPLSSVPQGPTGPEIPQGIGPGEAAQRVPIFQNGQPGTVPLGSITPGAPGYQSPSPFGSGRYGSQPGANAGFAPSGPSMGTPDMFVQMTDHWTRAVTDASHAQTNIGLAQNIKAYADQAATGKQGDKLAAANGLLSVFGVGGQTDLNTATDLLNKQIARLSLSSRAGAGGTDAAGVLADAANPHGSMTSAAIKEAADQVISSQKMALAQQKLLQPYRQSNDAQGYQSALSQFNNVADPRVWQFGDMNPAQRAAFKAGMSSAEQKEFSAKIRGAEQLGVVP